MKLILRFAIFFGTIAICYSQSATLTGVVTDSSEALVAGARISVVNLETGLRRDMLTNDAGAYTFTLLPVGRYRVDAVRDGFAPQSRPELKLDVDQSVRLDFKLRLGAVAETVEVTAAAALLDSETATVGQVISNKSIVEMPLNGRNYLSLATLTAGTSPDVGGRTQSEGGFAAGGAHGYQMNVQVDGLDNNTVYSGGPIGYEAQAVKPSIDAVGEFKVITNNLSAEYGGRMGGAVLVTIKSGTNQLHGTAYEFLRNDHARRHQFLRQPQRRSQAGIPPESVRRHARRTHPQEQAVPVRQFRWHANPQRHEFHLHRADRRWNAPATLQAFATSSTR